MIDAVKIPVTENNSEVPDEEKFTLNADEFKYFVLELKDMFVEGKEIDGGKAYRNAKYLAEMGRRYKEVKARKNVVEFTDEEWENIANEKTL